MYKIVMGQSGELQFDASNAIKALNLIGKHVDVRTFEVKDINTTTNDEIIARFQQARQRIAGRKVLPPKL